MHFQTIMKFMRNSIARNIFPLFAHLRTNGERESLCFRTQFARITIYWIVSVKTTIICETRQIVNTKHQSIKFYSFDKR